MKREWSLFCLFMLQSSLHRSFLICRSLISSSSSKSIKMSRQKQKREMPTIESTSVIERSEQPSKRSKSLSETSEPHIRDIINKYKVSPDRPSLKIISWNVNGLKALISNNKLTLDNLIAQHKPDVLCLQETKLQEDYVDQYDNIIPGYQTYWSCSTEKKGYAGTVKLILIN